MICPSCEGDGELATSHRFTCYSCKGTGNIYDPVEYLKAIEGEKEMMRNLSSSVSASEYQPVPNVILPTKEEIEEFKTLLEKAREYDRSKEEMDCELDEKKQKLLKLAEELGVDISFVKEEKPLEVK